LKLNCTHQLLFYADFTLLSESIHTTKITVFLVGSEEISLEAHDEKAKYMVMSREQNAEQQHYIKTGNISFECVEELKHLGKPVHITIPSVKILIAE
jgi:ethanolamine utilization cobalamin adenosyltransferase